MKHVVVRWNPATRVCDHVDPELFFFGLEAQSTARRSECSETNTVAYCNTRIARRVSSTWVTVK